MLESMGAPLPGESLLIAAALYCASTHKLDIVWVIVAAIIGAVMGDNFGYLIGRSIGFPLLSRWGRRIGLTEDRLMLGRYLFRRHGAKVVFFGRFIAILRTFAALLAGANRMPWPTFLLYNMLGGVGWAGGYTLAAFLIGRQIETVSRPFGIALGIAAALVLGSALLFLKRNEKRLTMDALRSAESEAPTRRRRRPSPA